MPYDDYKGARAGSPESRAQLERLQGRTRSGDSRPEMDRVSECAKRNVRRGKR